MGVVSQRPIAYNLESYTVGGEGGAMEHNEHERGQPPLPRSTFASCASLFKRRFMAPLLASSP